MSELIDLRSDTVTRPTPQMRQAMFEAEVGDDVYHEDPSINLLERRAAEIVGKEAAVFVPTGTMGNQCAIRAHTQRGEEIILHERSHIVLYEMGGVAQLAGCVTRTLPSPDGILSWDQIEPLVRPASDHFCGTSLIAVENSHNILGGHVYPQQVLNGICDEAHERGLKVHMDGARVFNAATYLGTPVHEVTARVDSVMFCLSKGLGAPVGSMLAGSADFIERARLTRKVLGGSMRQAGVLAAAGLVALEQSPTGLARDHENARFIAESLAEMPGISVNPADIQTNIVILDVRGTGMSGKELSAKLRERGVLSNAIAPYRMRMLTHFDVSREQCESAMRTVSEVLQQVGVAVGD
ncbi:MAG: low-specificity L-threonine aldolase [Acidobacteria bacterium]|nr:low-specificity L-threonine aldolase [Acidobacteriota bacterium]